MIPLKSIIDDDVQAEENNRKATLGKTILLRVMMNTNFKSSLK